MISLEHLAAACMVLFFIIGRWSLARILVPGGGRTPGFLSQPRTWLGLSLWLVLAPAVYAARQGQLVVFPWWTNRLALIFSLYLSLSVMWAPNWHLAKEKLAELVLLASAVLAFALLMRLFNAVHLQQRFWHIFTLLGVVFALQGGLTFGGERLAVFGGGPNVFGRNMGLLFVNSIGKWSSGGRKYIWLPLSVLFGLSVIASGSRGAAFATLVGCVVFTLPLAHHMHRRVTGLMLAGFAALGVVLYTPIGGPIAEVYQARFVQSHVELGGVGRIGLLRAAYEHGRRAPVLGLGLNGYRYHEGTYPHNLLAEAFAEGGGVGLALILGLFFSIMGYVVRHRRSLDPIHTAAVFLCITAAQASGDIYDARGVFLFPTMLAALPARPG